MDHKQLNDVQEKYKQLMIKISGNCLRYILNHVS